MTVFAEPEVLAAWLSDQRWFAGKGRGATVVGELEVPLVERPGVALVVADVATAGHDAVERYQLLVATDAAAGEDSVATDPDARVPDIAGGPPDGSSSSAPSQTVDAPLCSPLSSPPTRPDDPSGASGPAARPSPAAARDALA
ncbi:MAG: hypothetical protein JWN46_1895, partial [Acidimicrobiales bacterium]|nr:hypothetical protein [Acidimicrobiales bacterium]